METSVIAPPSPRGGLVLAEAAARHARRGAAQGWVLLRAQYDDGGFGFSGGTRP